MLSFLLLLYPDKYLTPHTHTKKMTNSWLGLTEQMLSLKNDTETSSQKLLIIDYPLVLSVMPHSIPSTWACRSWKSHICGNGPRTLDTWVMLSKCITTQFRKEWTFVIYSAMSPVFKVLTSQGKEEPEVYFVVYFDTSKYTCTYNGFKEETQTYLLVLQSGQNPLSFLPIHWICEDQSGRQPPEPDSMLLHWDQYMSAGTSIQ